MNPLLSQIPQSITLKVADLARQIEAGGERVVKLQTGDPDFDTPAPIVAACHEAVKAGATHYAATRGLAQLREALADKLLRVNGVQYDPASEVLVTNGGVHAVFCAINALLAPGDEVLIFDPCWMPYVSSTIVAGGTPVRMATDPADGFAMRAEQVEAHLTDRSRVLVINSPCNPTGQVLGVQELQKIAELARRHDLLVIADEVYEALVYDGFRAVSFASLPGMRERTITINSLSKTYAMSGWRVGYLAAGAELVSSILKLSQYSITNVAPFVQRAAITALTNPEVARFVERSVQIYADRRRRAVTELASIEGIRATTPDGAFYFMIDVSAFSSDSVEFSTRLLEQERVAVVPGAAFGACAEGTIRVTFAVGEDVLAEGIRRIGRMLHNTAAS